MPDIKTCDERFSAGSVSVVVMRQAASRWETSALEAVDRVASQMRAEKGEFQEVLECAVEAMAEILGCDACLVCLREGGELVVRASSASRTMLAALPGASAARVVDEPGGRPHEERPGLVAIAQNASGDPRCRPVLGPPPDRCEAFLSAPLVSRGRVVGLIEAQYRLPHDYTEDELRVVSAVAVLLAAEAERARLEAEIARLADKLEARKIIERAKGVLQREMQFSEEEAYRALQRQSRQRRKSMREVAEAIVMTDEIRRKVRDDSEA